MHSKYIWHIKNQEIGLIKRISETCQVSKPVAAVLANRSIIEVEDVYAFMNPDPDRFHDPYLLKDMDKAVARILTAKDKQEKVIIYGDYDVDGMTSTSILYMYLKENNFDVDYYIPDRLKEGYGVNCQAIDTISSYQTSLIITVDTGITAVDEVKHAQEMGIDVIITDHHECQEKLPEACAVIDPKRPDDTYPFKHLAGVGVAFKMIHALSLNLGDTVEIWKYLDIAAIGTVADIVSLVGENRIITKLAFRTIPTTWNIGLKALLEECAIKESDKLTSGIIGFRIAPRLNAAGRMGDAKRGVELFITKDPERALAIAKELNSENNHRQELEQQILKEAIEQIEENNRQQDNILVVASYNWHHGVMGIVASRITEKYYRPTIILCIEGEQATGSARSVEGFSIFDALYQQRTMLIKFGGHEMAAGLSIEREKIDDLRRELNIYANQMMDEQTLIPKLKADMLLDLEDITLPLIQEMQLLEPFGVDNPEPKFVVKGSVEEIRAIGKEKNHLRLSLKNKSNSVNGIGFGMSDYSLNYFLSNEVDVVGSLNINEWNGRQTPQIVMKDMRMNESMLEMLKVQLDQFRLIKQNTYEAFKFPIHIQREDCTFVYRTLLALDKRHMYTISLFRLVHDNPVYELCDIIKILLCLEVFLELGLIDYDLVEYDFSFQLIKGRKADLNQSKLFSSMQNSFANG